MDDNALTEFARMTATDVFVGVDAGTTGAKVALFDNRGNELGSGYCDYPCIYPHPGWVEQDVEDVWRGICKASQAARAQANVRDEFIRSVGLSSQRGTFILLDERYVALAPSVVWNDSRAKEMEPLLAERLGADRFRRITGMPVSGSWAIAKLAWLLRHRPDLMQRVRHVCNGQEFFLHRLGADRLESDPSSLTLNGMLDIRRLDWSRDVILAADLDPSLFPPVGKPASTVGKLSPISAEQLGLPAGTPVCRGGGDQQCAAVGAGVTKQGLAEVTIGTAAMMVAHLDSPDLVTGPAPYIGGHSVPGKWDAEGGAFSIGSCLKWWRDQFGELERARAAEQGTNVYDLIVDSARASPPGSRGVLFHPFFAGQVTPYYDATARGAFFGLGLDHDRSCLIRAMLEGCACEVRFMVDGMARDLEGGISELRVTGGAARSRPFMEIQANILGRPLVLLRNRECTVLGAAILGAVGSGYFADIDEAVKVMVAIDHTIDPECQTMDVYQDLFQIFRQAYEAQARSGVYQAIYQFQQRYF
jgi:xylulokinase